MQDVTIYILASLAVVYLVMAGAAVLVVWRLISERRYYDNPASLAIGVACWVLMIAGICGGGFARWGFGRSPGRSFCWWCWSKRCGRGVRPGNIRCSGR